MNGCHLGSVGADVVGRVGEDEVNRLVWEFVDEV